MRIAYLISHWLIQSALMVLMLLLFQFLHLFFLGVIESSVVLGSLFVGKLIVWVLMMFLGMNTGKIRSLFSILLSTLAALALLYFTGMVTLSMVSWGLLFGFVMFADLFAHLLLKGSAWREK